jgi:prepilin-type N-terminal cleavage/methylation domain-containing protein
MKIYKKGFTLVEVALALLVVSVGLLALFALFPAGLKLNKQAIDETQAALFAEEVLNGVRAQAATQRWDRIRTSIELPAPAPDVWNNPDTLVIRVTPGGANSFATNRYEKLGTRAVRGQRERYFDYGVRYRLEIQDIDELRKLVRLYVRPGEFGGEEPTYFFYTELYNHGQR